MRKGFVSSCLLLSQIQIKLLGGLGWVEGCLFPFWNHCAREMYCECEQPGYRRKVETTILCRNLLNNKCCLTTIIRHKERKNQDKCPTYKKFSVGCYGRRILYIRALRNTLICKSQALPKHASHRSVINEHEKERCNMLVPQCSYLLFLGKITY